MKTRSDLKRIYPHLRELIDSLWREYPGLYNERYDKDPEKWLLNYFGEDLEFGQALGQDHSINGEQSSAVGIGAITRAFREIVLGSYATDDALQNPTEWDELDRLISVGNGIDEANRHDAFLLFKSGFIKLFNALKIGKYKLGEKLPEDGILQFDESKLQLWVDGIWQEIAFKKDNKEASFLVCQISHGFSVGNPIKLSGSTWIMTQANSGANAGTVGLVSKVIDIDNFEYIPSGFLPGNYLPGAEYFLSTSVAGDLMILSDPEEWEIGQVREFIGTGVDGGLMVEIDAGTIIVTDFFNDKHITEFTFDAATRKLTARRSAGLPDLEIVIPIGISLVNANWNEANPLSKAYIENKPNLAPVALSGNYSDLTNQPNIPDSFTKLKDVIPENYIGKANNIPIVRPEEDKMDLIETEELETETARLTLLADCPQSLSGFGGYLLRVKADETGIEFYLP